jgi:hypothetical protein
VTQATASFSGLLGGSSSQAAAGFRIAVISEPVPAPAARELFPDDLAIKPRFLHFLFFVLRAG